MTLRKQPTTIENLPDDAITTHILFRLPVKQLAQMRSLSKPWNAFLTHPDFIKSHLDRSIHNNVNDGILLVFEDGYCFKDVKPFTARPRRSPDLQLIDFIKHPLPNTKGDWFAIGSVNGLICFSYRKDDTDDVVHIWNPSLSALLPLPPYSMPSVNRYEILFGFDPITDDYKVVKLPKRRSFPVEVYSMRRGSWEFITAKVPFKRATIYYVAEVCVDGHNGHLHWECYSGDRQKNILSFDLYLETFNVISFPKSIQDKRDCSNVLGFITGKLCVISRRKHGECEVWVMDEYGVAESWVKHLVFPTHFHIEYPVGFTLNNEFVFIANDWFIVMYDLSASKVVSFKIFGGFCFKIVPYVESLVWVVPPKRGRKRKPGQNFKSAAIEQKPPSVKKAWSPHMG